MTAEELLQPLIARAVKAKRYSRQEATRRAIHWLAGELKVDPITLIKLTGPQERMGRLLVNRYIRKAAKPVPATPYIPLDPQFWDTLRREWGNDFFNWFFGEGECKGLLSPGQKEHAEFSNMRLTDAG